MSEESKITKASQSEMVKTVGEQIEEALGSEKRRQFGRFALAALGSIPWIGGFLGASAAYSAETDQSKITELLRQWLQEHEEKIRKLSQALIEIFTRLNAFGAEAEERIDSDDYLALVRKGFVIWDQADTDEKRELIKRLLTNAAGTKLSDDDVVRLFLDWIERYHEAHFGIIRAVYKNRGITRLGIWRSMGRTGPLPKENSSDADLFRMLIDDLSTGRVIRQEREVNSSGQFLKKSSRGRQGTRGSASTVMKSSFDDSDRYELSELGGEFVHYVLHDAVSRIEDGSERI